MKNLGQRILGTDPDTVYSEFASWAADQGLSLYPHQDEAIIELLSGNNVILATPTGSGKSMVATAAQYFALCGDRVSFYTAPIKALVSEKFFALCEAFGAENVGMLTGDAAVNADAPIICCTAEILANIALREGADADVGLVVMDEFHYYSEFDRGWAWQVPLLALPQAQFLLMSATLGDVSFFLEDMTRRNGRDSVLVDDAERPVPLSFSWSLNPLNETLDELVATKQVPAYVVHFTQKDAVEHAKTLLTSKLVTRGEKDEIAEEIGAFRFGAGFGRTLSKLLRNGVGVHHAGMLPKYRRLVEQLAQRGLLKVVCGTDTLGVGINVPIRTVLFTGLAKFDGSKQRILRTREFQQIAGRAGRAGYDTAGYVVVQAPEHVIENEKAKAKAAAKNAANPKKNSKAQLKRAPEGSVVWTEQTFTKLVEGKPEQLVSRMKVDNAMLLNVVARETDAFAVLRDLLGDNHDDPRQRVKLIRRALRLARSLVHSGVLARLDEVDEFGRRYVLTEALPEDFALNQPLAHFALEALDVLDPESPEYTLDVVSVMEAVLDSPRQILFAQQRAARGEAIAEMKADGIEYEERMALLEEISWPQPLAELLGATYEIYRGRHPWLPEDGLEPKSIVREMFEQGYSFTEFVSRYDLARGEGLVLRYLTDAYRTLRHTVPEQHRTEQFEELLEWLGESVRQTDSSLLDEWEALTDPDRVAEAAAQGAPPPPRPLSERERAFGVMIRNAMWRRVELCARDDIDGLMRGERATADLFDPPREVEMTRTRWDNALEAYYAEHDEIRTDADAHGPSYLHIERNGRSWQVRQTLADPDDNRDWVIEAVVDLDASDELGEAVVTVTDFRRWD
ncbi:DEAD/DEAH box helicase [Nocardioides sp. Bht2]|uniref:DEAD/DEAH box helicase n=1 Tax=Nocardioides sp. Bht2 TaxID=3392297 RepID=UPI0039B44F8E